MHPGSPKSPLPSHPKLPQWPTCALLGFLAACGSSSSSANSAFDSGTPSSDGARTLANCETSFTAEVPAFFSKYFRCVSGSTTGSATLLTSRDLPPHLSYYYGASSPNYVPFDTSRGPQYRSNPNTLSEKNLRLSIPQNPVAKGISITAALVDGTVGTSREEYTMGPAGIALDSVALFNQMAAPGDDIEQEKFTFDDYNAHPTPDLFYHYHTVSKGPLEVLQSLGFVTKSAPGQAEIELYGIMCDGTVLLGCTELDGSTPSRTDFDAQAGHVHDLRDRDGITHFAGRYHVHMCEAFGRTYTPEIQYYSTCSN